MFPVLVKSPLVLVPLFPLEQTDKIWYNLEPVAFYSLSLQCEELQETLNIMVQFVFIWKLAVLWPAYISLKVHVVTCSSSEHTVM